MERGQIMEDTVDKGGRQLEARESESRYKKRYRRGTERKTIVKLTKRNRETKTSK